MKILLFGCNGQVGWELQRSLNALGDVLALGSNAARNPRGACGDLRDLHGIATTVREVKPDVIVNAAAHTAVDRAETEPDLAHAINASAVEVLADEAQRLGAWLVHYSTDYVFGGSGTRAWREEDACAPLSVYGWSKLAGERAVAHCVRHLVFRTSWVYAARGGNFAKTMLRLAGERDQLQVIDDQIGAPTSAELLADVTAHALVSAIAQPELAGLYHCTAGGETSWCGYARYVLEQAQGLGLALRAGPGQVHAIATSSYPTAAQRPLNSRLDTSRLRDAFSIHLPHWQLGVRRMLHETIGNKPT